MHNGAIFFLFAASLFVASVSSGQSSTNKFPRDPDPVREKQMGTSVPDGSAFEIILEMIAGQSEEDPSFGVDWLQQKMGLSRERATSMVDDMLRARSKLNAEVAEAQRQLFCDVTGSNRSNDELPRLFDVMDDMKEAIAQKHFVLFKSQISADEAARLEQFVHFQKRQMGRVKIDHKKMYEKTQRDPSRAITGICIASSQK